MEAVFHEKFVVTQKFGLRPEYYGQWGFKGHEGIDLTGVSKKPSVPFYAIEDGIVVRDTDTPDSDISNKAYGIKVVIWNPNTFRAWWYCHLASNLVKLGDRVGMGQALGMTNNTGNSSGPHLHLGLRMSDSNGYVINTNNGYKGFIDPEPFLVQYQASVPAPAPILITDQTKIPQIDNMEVQAIRSLVNDLKRDSGVYHNKLEQIKSIVNG